MAQTKWTLEACKAEALKYRTRGAFAEGNRAAYEATRKAGWLNTLIPLTPTKFEGLTLEQAREAAAPFNSRRQFQLTHSGIYQAAKKLGYLDAITAHYAGCKKPDGYWSKERCREEALKWGNVTGFKRKAGSAYQKCSEMGWGEEVYGDLEFQARPSGYWTKARVLEAAKGYEFRVEFKARENGAYEACLRGGYADEAMAHMADRRLSDMDVIYVWEAEGETYNGKKVYKIGITSDRLGPTTRMGLCARANMMSPKLLTARCLGEWHVPALEKYLHTFGEDPRLDVPNGKTEFRALTAEELAVILRIIESHPVI